MPVADVRNQPKLLVGSGSTTRKNCPYASTVSSRLKVCTSLRTSPRSPPRSPSVNTASHNHHGSSNKAPVSTADTALTFDDPISRENGNVSNSSSFESVENSCYLTQSLADETGCKSNFRSPGRSDRKVPNSSFSNSAANLPPVREASACSTQSGIPTRVVQSLSRSMNAGMNSDGKNSMIPRYQKFNKQGRSDGDQADKRARIHADRHSPHQADRQSQPQLDKQSRNQYDREF